MCIHKARIENRVLISFIKKNNYRVYEVIMTRKKNPFIELNTEDPLTLQEELLNVRNNILYGKVQERVETLSIEV